KIAIRRRVALLKGDDEKAIASNCTGIDDQGCGIEALQIGVAALGGGGDHGGSEWCNKAEAGDTVLHDRSPFNEWEMMKRRATEAGRHDAQVLIFSSFMASKLTMPPPTRLVV